MSAARAALAAVLLTMLTACATVPNQPPRLEPTSYGCMAQVLRQKLPPNLPDKRAHCTASGLITRYCSQTEAYVAGISKELRDLLGYGDAEWSDWSADRVGVNCARRAEDDEAIAQCCSDAEQP